LELTHQLAEELLHKGFEAPDLDYKLTFDNTTQAWMELAKDIYGMANSGGGYIVIGVEDGTFNLIGMDVSFHKDSLEWVERTSKWATGRIEINYLEHIKEVNGAKRKFPVIQVLGSIGTFIVPKQDGIYPLKNGQNEIAFKVGIVYTRDNSRTIPARSEEYSSCFWSLLQRTIERTGGTVTPVETITALCKKAEPDTVEETLWFNLFPVTEFPDYIYSLETNLREPREVYERIREKTEGLEQDIPSFLMEDKKLYSLSKIDEKNPLFLCVDENMLTIFGSQAKLIDIIPTTDWLHDKIKNRKLVKLLNFNLKDLCRRKGFFFDPHKERFYSIYNCGPVPQVTWKPYKKTSTRNLVYPRTNSTTGKMSYCEHFAGRIRFTILGEGVYLVIEPLRVLTVDGKNPLDQNRSVKISTRKNFYYHNNNYLYDMKLWLHLLAGNRTEIILGENESKIIVDINPLSSTVDFGILDDQHTNEDFLDSLKSEPFEYDIEYEEEDESNPLTESSLEE